MLAKYLVLTLLPVIAYSYISVVLKTGRTKDEAAINYSGDDVDVITDQERKVFGLSDDVLKRATKIYKGETCTDVYVKSPTPWGNVYLQFDWKQVETVIEPISYKIVNIKSENVTLSSQQYHNYHHKRNIQYESRVQAEVNETVKHTWSGAKLTSREHVQYRVSFGPGSVGGMTTFAYGSTFGNNTSEYRRALLGAVTNSVITVGPNQTITEELIVIKGTMEVEVKYEAYLIGRVFCNYANSFQGHHFYAFYVSNLQRAVNATRFKTATEKISLTFYSYPKVKMFATNNRAQLANFDGEIDEIN